MSFPRYPAYKDSGVEWLGSVPDHWPVVALAYRYDVALGKMLDGKQITGKHLAPYLRNADVQWGAIRATDLSEMDFDAEDRERFALQKGDLLVCEGGEVGRCAVWNGELDECYYQKALHRLRPIDHARDTPQYLQWVLYAAVQAGCFAAEESKATIAHLPAETLRRHRFAIPSLREQNAIAAFLDGETAKIDALVAEQERLIELLKEKRQSVISHAVTKGLKPDAPMKDSGIEWLGYVPAHWAVVPFGSAVWFQEGPGIMASDFWDEGVPLLRVSSVRGRWATLEGCNYLDPKKVEERWQHFRVEIGDLLISASASMGTVCEVGNAVVVGAVPYTGIIRLAPATDSVIRDFIRAFVVSTAFAAQIDVIKAGATIQHFGPTHLRSLKLPLPPRDEQLLIAKRIDDRSREIDELLAEADHAISLLLERRSALITAAVTGQIDVRPESMRTAA